MKAMRRSNSKNDQGIPVNKNGLRAGPGGTRPTGWPHSVENDMAHKTSADYVLEVRNETKAEFVHSESKYLVKFLDGYHVNMKTE